MSSKISPHKTWLIRIWHLSVKKKKKKLWVQRLFSELVRRHAETYLQTDMSFESESTYLPARMLTFCNIHEKMCPHFYHVGLYMLDQTKPKTSIQFKHMLLHTLKTSICGVIQDIHCPPVTPKQELLWNFSFNHFNLLLAMVLCM